MLTQWKGMLSFGLVYIPVSLASSVRKKTISFNQLRRGDYSSIHYKKVASDGAEVAAADIIRGYEVSPGSYVVVTDEDLSALEPKSSRIIDIKEFVRLEQIDPRYFDASYYLVPEPGTAKAYALLLESMRQAGVVGIARFVLRNKEYLAAIRPTDGAFTLSTLLFHDEVIDPREEMVHLLAGHTELSEKEVATARQLIASLTEEFNPRKYSNEYYEQVMALIDAKTATQQVSGQAQALANVLDLMAALEASVSKFKKKATKPQRKKASGAE